MKKYTLSQPHSRTELITRFKESLVVPPAKVPTPPPVKPTDAQPATPGDDAGDQTDVDMTAKIEAIKTAIADAQATQAKDPDGTSDPDDVKVNDLLTQALAIVEQLATAQDADGKKEVDPAAPKTPSDGTGDPSDAPPVKLSVDNTTPKTDPVDEQGNVDGGAVCATPGCSHLGSAHSDTSNGKNNGACTMADCACEQMSFDTNVGTPNDQEGDDSNGDGGGPNNAGGDDTAPHSALLDTTPTIGATTGPTNDVQPLAPADTNPPPEMPGGMNMGPAFTIPVMVIEGQETGDGRGIALQALSWGPMPMPLMGLATSTHDPMGFDMNDPSIICGRIDSLERAPGENGTQLIKAMGYFLANDDGLYFADLVEQMGRVGISADIAVDESEETISGMDDYGWPIFSSTLLAGTIQGCTVVPFPAFDGAYIVLGDGGVIPEIPQAVEDMPVPELVAAGGQLIHYMAKVDCEPCAQGLDVLTAAGGPMAPPKSWFSDPNFTLGDDRLKEIFTGRGEKRFGGAWACPPTITDDGEVFGHLAPWGVCHTGQAGGCVTAPHSKTNYAHFMREGQQVMTAEGDLVTVGVLTFNAGHAPSTGRNVTPAAAMAHYDNTATAFADVVVGEDEYGIWYHGAVRPGLSDSHLRAARAASPSGDWREMGGNLELVAVLEVNQPGFPIAVVADGGRAVSLVAAGAYVIKELMDETITPIMGHIEGDPQLRLAMAPILEAEKIRMRQLKLEAQKIDARRRFATLRPISKEN
jgi:hypothetical protein